MGKQKQLKQKVGHDQNHRFRTFEIGNPVFIHNLQINRWNDLEMAY